MFISTAYAQTAGAGDGAFGMGGIVQLLPIVAIFVIFYFLLIRPQQRKAKEHKAMLASVRRVVTGGGILGMVTKVLDEHHVQVEIAEGVRVKVLKSTIADIPSRTAPAQATNARRDDKRSEESEVDEEAEDESEAAETRETSKS